MKISEKEIDNVSNKNFLFELFAPDAKKVELILNDKQYNMTNNSGTWKLSLDTKDNDQYCFKIDEHLCVPAPLSYTQNGDVHGKSEVVNIKKPNDFKPLKWSESIIYELHIGTFTKEGTIKAAQSKLDYLKELGINTIELMPIADFPGEFNWGYDGVLLFAPDKKYGTPNEFIDFINAAHDKGMQVILDVVYNHFGPDGNYLYCYAKSKFFDEKIQTPWGNAINFKERFVRNFYVENVKHWLDTYGFDGLRFDAVQEIKDDSDYHILQEISDTTKKLFPQKHLILENLDNNSNWLNSAYEAQWNDDFHHTVHVTLTGENKEYYADYSKEFTGKSNAYYLGRTLCEGFAYQGEKSYFDKNNPRGSKSKDLPPHNFINFIQNHDQVGNRPFGERLSQLIDIDKYKLAASLYLLCPSIPMLFMGEEWGSKTPFMYFTDLCEELKESIREGRKNEFKEFFDTKHELPDPTIEKTFINSKLNWNELKTKEHKNILEFYQKLIKLRKKHIIPIIDKITMSEYKILSDSAIEAKWKFPEGKLILLANLSDSKIDFKSKYKNPIWCDKPLDDYIPAYSINWFIEYE